MKKVKGAEGKEVIPNVEVWMAIPGLIKVGDSVTVLWYLSTFT